MAAIFFAAFGWAIAMIIVVIMAVVSIWVSGLLAFIWIPLLFIPLVGFIFGGVTEGWE
mgnify:CR=1 FL=1